MIEDRRFRQERIFGIDFDVVTMSETVDWVLRCVAMGRLTHSRFVVTPNVSLTMLHQQNAEFRRVIHHADLRIVDGMPLVTASRWLGKGLPERVAGSDLVFNLFSAAIEEVPLRVFLLGAAEGVAEHAASIIHQRWPAVQVAGTHSPPFGFEHDEQLNSNIVALINASEADLLIVGLGAPKQETWAFRHREQLTTAVSLCVGGTIDFIAGEQSRAPRFVRQSGFEWVWRICTNPRRLLWRYVRDAIRLPRLFLDEVAGRCPVWSRSDGDPPSVTREDTNTPSEQSGGVAS